MEVFDKNSNGDLIDYVTTVTADTSENVWTTSWNDSTYYVYDINSASPNTHIGKTQWVPKIEDPFVEALKDGLKKYGRKNG